MRKRTAEKVISRSILALAVYPKKTMAEALRKRPHFWTVHKEATDDPLAPARKRLRLEFGSGHDGTSLLTFDYVEEKPEADGNRRSGEC